MTLDTVGSLYAAAQKCAAALTAEFEGHAKAAEASSDPDDMAAAALDILHHFGREHAVFTLAYRRAAKAQKRRTGQTRRAGTRRPDPIPPEPRQ